MAVYVDDFYKTGIKFRGMLMSHMIADTRVELITMVRRISMSPKWIQHKDTAREHFDVCKVKRQLAIQAGAIPIGMRELSTMVNIRTYEGHEGRNLFNEKNEIKVNDKI